MLATLLRPDAGGARVFGFDVVGEATAVRSLIGVTGQYASVDEDLTATENLVVFAKLLGHSRTRAKVRAEDLLHEFGLEGAADRPLKNFSGGMRRRLDLAASLISRPPLLFLDEPTTGLDPRTRAQMWHTVRDLVAGGSTVLLTTQYLEEADQLADRIAVIDHGRLVADGTADDLKAAVGGSTLLLVPADPSHAAAAAAIVAGFVDGDIVVSGPAGQIEAPIADLEMLPELLFVLRGAGIDVEEISVQKPSLDEVFFSITGQPMKPQPVSDEPDVAQHEDAA